MPLSVACPTTVCCLCLPVRRSWRVCSLVCRSNYLPLSGSLAESRSEERRVGKECRSRRSPSARLLISDSRAAGGRLQTHHPYFFIQHCGGRTTLFSMAG